MVLHESEYAYGRRIVVKWGSFYGKVLTHLVREKFVKRREGFSFYFLDTYEDE